LTKVSLHDEFVLVETDDINLDDLRKGLISLTYYVVEIHDTENDKVGILTDTETGEISKFNTFSQAKVQSVLLKEQLTDNMYTKIVTQEDSASSEAK